jgi:hypothetical protein
MIYIYGQPGLTPKTMSEWRPYIDDGLGGLEAEERERLQAGRDLRGLEEEQHPLQPLRQPGQSPWVGAVLWGLEAAQGEADGLRGHGRRQSVNGVIKSHQKPLPARKCARRISSRHRQPSDFEPPRRGMQSGVGGKMLYLLQNDNLH